MTLRLRCIAFAVALSATAMMSAPAARAQGFAEDLIRPVEILNYLYANGYSRVRMPRLRGDVYVILATDAGGRRLRLVVDAYEGILLDRRVLGRERDKLRADLDERSSPKSDVQIDKKKPKRKKDKIAALPPDKGPLVAPGATENPKTAKLPDTPELPAKPAESPKPKPPVAKPKDVVGPSVPPVKAKPLPQVDAPKPAAPSAKLATGPVQGPNRPKVRVIPITPPAELDAPPLPKPPPLRSTPSVPVVGLD